MRHAIIVAGHAVYQSGDPVDDRSWTLQPFQSGEARFFVEHIEQGVRLASVDPNALLVFSGGQTRVEAGPRSEAEGYRSVAQHRDWWGHPEVAARTLLEEYARDSYENLLFSLQLFAQHAGAWPFHASLVSWRFKEARFALHREAIGWPVDRFTFHGPNDPPVVDLASEARTLDLFQKDPHGTGAELAAKKRARNPYGRSRLETWPCSKSFVTT